MRGRAGHAELAPRRCAASLAPPTVALRLDLSTAPPRGVQSAPPVALRALTADGGAADAILVWWSATLHASVPPLTRRRTTRQRARALAPGCLCAAKPVAPGGGGWWLAVAHDDDDIWLSLTARDDDDAPPPPPPPRALCSCGVHALWGRERLQQLNALPVEAAVGAAAAAVGACRRASAARVLDLSDGPLWSILLARAGARACCVERSVAAARLSSRFVAESGLSDCVDVVPLPEGDDEDAWAGEPPAALGGAFDLIVIEPSFGELHRCWAGEQLAAMQSARQWAEASGLAGRSTPQLPSRATLEGCSSRCRRSGGATARWERCAASISRASTVWSTPTTTLADAVAAAVAVAAPARHGDDDVGDGGAALPRRAAWRWRGEAEFVATAAGTAHAVVAWLNFGAGDGDGDDSLLVRTGPANDDTAAPTSWAQAFGFFAEPLALAAGQAVRLRFELGGDGELRVERAE